MSQEKILYYIDNVANATHDAGMRYVDKDRILAAINELRKQYVTLHPLEKETNAVDDNIIT